MAKYYVYTLSYPPEMGGAVFYVGKGSGQRLSLHDTSTRLTEDDSPRAQTIRSIQRAGYRVVKARVFETDDEQDAYRKEAELINHYGITNLANCHTAWPGCDHVQKQAVGTSLHPDEVAEIDRIKDRLGFPSRMATVAYLLRLGIKHAA